MRLGPALVPGRLTGRRNRFAALVEVDGREVLAHVPNSGRLTELFLPGAAVTLAPPRGAGSGRTARRTLFDLVSIRHEEAWVCIDARLPNALVAEAVAGGRLDLFRGEAVARREPAFGESRLDLLCGGPGRPDRFVETKSVTLVRGGVARFPDAPTARGVRHLEELERAVRMGYRAAVVFVVQRGDARGFAPNDDTDPAFGEALRRARRSGVDVVAVGCRVSPETIEIAAELPLLF